MPGGNLLRKAIVHFPQPFESLIVDGPIASRQTFVNAGALLGGHGFIDGCRVNNGMFSPGNSPGTLTVSGDYTQNASGTLRIRAALIEFLNGEPLANLPHDLELIAPTQISSANATAVSLRKVQISNTCKLLNSAPLA